MGGYNTQEEFTDADLAIDYLQRRETELRAQGLSAGQHEVGQTDEIAVSNTGCTGEWYGYHICNYGGPKVVWNPGARRGWWAIDPGYCP